MHFQNLRRSSWRRSRLSALVLSLSLLAVDNTVAEVSFDWATVGDTGNAPDGSSGFGTVDDTYRIATTHVTNTQYVEFLNSVDPDGDVAEAAINPPFPQPAEVNGIYNPNMSAPQSPNIRIARTGGIDYTGTATSGSKYSVKAGQENFPATWISWNAAARFANWMNNGQGSGDTETGVYNNIPDDANDPIPAREEGAKFFLPSENEFYKAAYYDPTKNGGQGGYWQYGIQSDTAPTAQGPAGGTTSANYAASGGIIGDTFWQTNFGALNEDINYLTDVGAYTDSTSYYGLHDVDGLVYQFTEDWVPNPFNSGQQLPIYRGGSWRNGDLGSGAAYSANQWFAHVRTWHTHGLRIASLVESLDGDFDGDGDVDGQDFLEWQRTDGTADGLAVWQVAYGAGSLAAVTSVPEPSSVVLVTTFLAASALSRQRRRVGSIQE